MEKQLLATVVVFLFCLLYTVAIAAQTNGGPEEVKRAARMRSNVEPEASTLIQNLGFGKRVDVKLKDGSKASGRITAVAADRFLVTNSKGASRPIAYMEVSCITKQNEKLGIFHRPWVGIMFTAAAVGSLIVVGLQFFD